MKINILEKINNKKLIITVSIVFAIMAVATTVIIVVLSHHESVGDILALGDRYMSEMDYESAIREYRHAIEIDPKSEDTYIKLAEAYIAMGDIDSAIKALEEGYDATQSERILERLNALRREEADDETTASNQTDAVTTASPETEAPPQETDVPVPERMVVKTAPQKTTYYVGDTLDLTGLTLTVTYSDGTTDEISEGYTCDVETLDEAGTVEVTVRYGETETTVTVTVEETSETANGETEHLDAPNTEVPDNESEVAEDFTWTLEDGVLTLSGHGRMPDWNVSLLYTWAPWHERSDEIKKVIINDGILNIGEYAFRNCYNLTSIDISGKVASIGENAFSGCYNLTSITLPDGVISIGDYAFAGCEKLTMIMIPLGVTSIGDFAFSGCYSLTSITVPDNVISIGDGVFSFCYSLASISLPKRIKSIGRDAFYKCTSLTSIVIPDEVLSIGEYAFGSCNNLISITLSNRIESISEYTFCDCSNLTSIFIPNGVKSIGDYAFEDCYSLTSITLPYSIENIGNEAFWNCHNLAIHGNAGSYAEQYAKENDIPFTAE